MDNSKFVDHLKNENIDPILILKNLYEQCSTINKINIQYLNEMIKSINSNNINNINNEISIIFERFKVDVVSKFLERKSSSTVSSLTESTMLIKFLLISNGEIAPVVLSGKSNCILDTKSVFDNFITYFTLISKEDGMN